MKTILVLLIKPVNLWSTPIYRCDCLLLAAPGCGCSLTCLQAERPALPSLQQLQSLQTAGSLQTLQSVHPSLAALQADCPSMDCLQGRASSGRTTSLRTTQVKIQS